MALLTQPPTGPHFFVQAQATQWAVYVVRQTDDSYALWNWNRGRWNRHGPCQPRDFWDNSARMSGRRIFFESLTDLCLPEDVCQAPLP